MTGSGRETLGGGAAVDYGRVESTLQALWKLAAADVTSAGRPPVTRVTTLNLVVLAGSEPDAERAAAAAGELCARYPGRVLLVCPGAGPDGVTAEISAQCHLAGGGRQVCSELVRLAASGKTAHEVAQVVAPLLLPDLPVVLWLPAHPARLPVDEDLLALADRVAVDARDFPDVPAALERLAAWSAACPAVADLAWLRLERWRALAAQLFDEAPARRDLQRLERVEVEYLAGPGEAPTGRIEALYLAGWIASRLGCGMETPPRADAGRDMHAGREAHMARRPDGGVLHLVLVRAEVGAAGEGLRAESRARDLSRVRLTADGGRARYDLRRLDAELVEVVIEAPRACPAPARVALPVREPLDLLSAAVSGRGREEPFVQALAAARVLAGAR